MLRVLRRSHVYQPHLRYFSIAKAIFRASVYSYCWYRIFMRDFATADSYSSIEWEEDCEFVYQSLYHFSFEKWKALCSGGAWDWKVNFWFSISRKMKRALVPDGLIGRLVSSVIDLLREGELYQDYLNPKGLWQFEEHLQEMGACRSQSYLCFFDSKETTEIWERWLQVFGKKIAQLPEKERPIFRLLGPIRCDSF